MTIEALPVQDELWRDEPPALKSTERPDYGDHQGSVGDEVATIDPSKWEWYEGMGDGEKEIIAWMVEIILRANGDRVSWGGSDGRVTREPIPRFVALSSARFGISPVAVSSLTQELLNLGVIRDGNRERSVGGRALEVHPYMDGKLQGAGGHLER